MEQRPVLSPRQPARGNLTRDFILSRFAAQSPVGRRGSGGPLAEEAAGRRGDHSMMPGAQPPASPLTPAAVLVPIVEHPHGLTVLLTQRTAHLSDHAGQIAFPGGRIEPTDPHPIAAALREAEEEVGLPASHVEIVGRLDTYVTGTGFEVIPVVAFVRVPYPMKPDPFEVADVFEVPLDFIIDPGNLQRGSREWKGTTRTFFVLPYEQRYIWGATAGMLVNLAEVLAEEKAPDRPATDF
jgi:8-oxo-dGTP pyrophosphatase MutT (NUDIX family)